MIIGRQLGGHTQLSAGVLCERASQSGQLPVLRSLARSRARACVPAAAVQSHTWRLDDQLPADLQRHGSHGAKRAEETANVLAERETDAPTGRASPASHSGSGGTRSNSAARAWPASGRWWFNLRLLVHSQPPGCARERLN